MRFAHHLAQDVEPTAMRHAERDVAQTQLAPTLNDLFKRRDHRLAAVEAEALGAGIFNVEEILESLRLGELRQDGALAFLGELDLLGRPLDALLDPGLLGRIGNVEKLEADGSAVSPAQDLEHLADGRVFESEDMIDEDFPVVVGFVEAVGGRMQFFVILRLLEAERIEVGMQMATHTKGADHH